MLICVATGFRKLYKLTGLFKSNFFQVIFYENNFRLFRIRKTKVVKIDNLKKLEKSLLN